MMGISTVIEQLFDGINHRIDWNVMYVIDWIRETYSDVLRFIVTWMINEFKWSIGFYILLISGKSIGRKIGAHALSTSTADHSYSSELLQGVGSGLFDDRTMGVDPDDPIVDLLMQITMRSSPFSEGTSPANNGSSHRDTSSSRAASSLINRAQRNRLYAQFMHQHRQQGGGLTPIAHISAAAAAAGVKFDTFSGSSPSSSPWTDAIRSQQQKIKKFIGGGTVPANVQPSRFEPKAPPMR